MNRRIAALIVRTISIAMSLPLCPAMAETIEVALGVQVSRRTFPAPVNETPFYGFVDKSPTLRQADDVFVSIAVKFAGSRAQAFDAVATRGWEAIAANDMAEAAKRFNQASLLLPEQSQIFHGFAIIASARFDDPVFAEEPFKIARKQPGARESLNADYGRMLLLAKRPGDAEPVLEQAVRDAPTFGNAWSNLGVARLQNGNPSGACLAADRADKLQNAANVNMDIKWIWSEAQCSGH
jgi:tetratricopeptide (TPR) repeat protein